LPLVSSILETSGKNKDYSKYNKFKAKKVFDPFVFSYNAPLEELCGYD